MIIHMKISHEYMIVNKNKKTKKINDLRDLQWKRSNVKWHKHDAFYVGIHSSNGYNWNYAVFVEQMIMQSRKYEAKAICPYLIVSTRQVFFQKIISCSILAKRFPLSLSHHFDVVDSFVERFCNIHFASNAEFHYENNDFDLNKSNARTDEESRKQTQKKKCILFDNSLMKLIYRKCHIEMNFFFSRLFW